MLSKVTEESITMVLVVICGSFWHGVMSFTDLLSELLLRQAVGHVDAA